MNTQGITSSIIDLTAAGVPLNPPAEIWRTISPAQVDESGLAMPSDMISSTVGGPTQSECMQPVGEVLSGAIVFDQLIDVACEADLWGTALTTARDDRVAVNLQTTGQDVIAHTSWVLTVLGRKHSSGRARRSARRDPSLGPGQWSYSLQCRSSLITTSFNCRWLGPHGGKTKAQGGLGGSWSDDDHRSHATHAFITLRKKNSKSWRIFH